MSACPRVRVDLLLVLAVLLVTRAALAELPVGVEVAAIGRGSEPPGDVPPNPMGLGIGVRGGVSLLGLYGGLSFIAYSGADGGGHATLFGAEAGYGGEPTKGFTLRGQLGVGAFSATYVPVPIIAPGAPEGQTIAGPPITGGGLYLEPGVLAMFSINWLLLGTDLRLLLVPSKEHLARGSPAPDDAALAIGLQVGLKF